MSGLAEDVIRCPRNFVCPTIASKKQRVNPLGRNSDGPSMRAVMLKWMWQVDVKDLTYCGPEGSNNVGQNYLSSQVSHALDVWRQFDTVTTLLRKVQPIQFREAAVAI